MTPEVAELSHDLGRSGGESLTTSSEVASVSHPAGVSSSVPKTFSSSNVKSRPSPVREASVAIPVAASVTASAQKKIQLAQNPQSRAPRIEPWMTPEEAEISHDFGRSGEESVVVGSPSGGGSRTASSEVASVSHPAGVSSSVPKTFSSSNVKSRPSPVREASVAIPVAASVTASAQKKIQLAQNPQSRVPRIEPWMTPEMQRTYH